MFNLDSAVTAELDKKYAEIIESASVHLGSLVTNNNFSLGLAPRPDQRRATYMRALTAAAKLSDAELGKNYAEKLTRAYETTTPHYEEIVARFEVYRDEKYFADLQSYIKTLKSRGSVVPSQSELEVTILTKLWFEACTYVASAGL